MARERTYRHDIRCPDCGSNWMRKNGLARGKQSYRCGDCGRRYFPDAAYHRPSAAIKAQGVEMYLEGSSLSAIGRVFGYSATAVHGWVKKRGREALERLRERGRRRTEGAEAQRAAAVVSCDEMWTYKRARRAELRADVWIWTAVVEEADGSRWVDFEVSDRSERTFLRLYERLPDAKLDAYILCMGGFLATDMWWAREVR